jgi:restriction endonuclease S subunit
MTFLPTDWKEVRLGDILGYEQPTKYLVSSSDYVEGGQVPVLTAGKSFLLGYTDDVDGTYTNLPAIIFDDFTTATQWVDFEFKVKSSACKMLKPKHGTCNLRYVFERLRALNYQTSDHKRHWISVFHSMEMLMPPLKEQEAIAEVLSNTDAAIESLDALIAKKRDVKQATMQQLLTGRTRLPGFTAEWIEVRLGDLLGYEQPTKYLVSSSDYVEGGQVPVLTAGKSFLLGYTDDNDGIYTNLPTIIFDDFTTATQWVDFEFKVKSSACKMLRPKNGACNPRYVFERLRALNYQTSDHKRHWISVFHSMEMMMPPLKEQEAIAEVLTVMDDELRALTEQVSKLRMVKEGMMQDLLSGKVRLV